MIFKRSKKETREFQVLLGLVDLYLETGKPIGSNTLREHGFQNLSSATIRNYFVQLEREGYLRQPHSSGGRVPTNEAFRLYANEMLSSSQLKPDVEEKLAPLGEVELRSVTSYLQQAAEKLSDITDYAVFLSSVRFDHDFILEVKLVGIDSERILCVLITDFGQILTEVLSVSNFKFNALSLRRVESYIQWRLKGGTAPENLTIEEENVAQRLYSEIMVRYLVRYSNFSDEEVFRTGFSHLLAYPEFHDPLALATGLSLFENAAQMRLVLSECTKEGILRFWIGSDLAPFATAAQGCSVIAIPYYIGQTIAGAVGILGPCRLPYRTLFGTLRFFSECISKSLTKSLFKFKLSFRQPRSGSPYVQLEERSVMDQTSKKLLDIKESSQ